MLCCLREESELKIKITRFIDEPIIYPFLEDEIGSNIQGPSLIKTPSWLKNPLGKYYLYFADHKGDQIKLAYADELQGPWKILIGGTLKLKDSLFLVKKPDLPKTFDLKKLRKRRVHEDLIDYVPEEIDDLTYPHIASPDVHVDNLNKRLVMYYHGLDEFGLQKTRVATSIDGINFKAKEKIVGWPYFRRFTYKEENFALSMPGIIYKGTTDIDNFTIVNQVMEKNTRHSALLVRNDELLIFFTRKGDAPERILLTRINLKLPISEWKTHTPVEILKPEREWEGAFLPKYKSVASAINTPVNQLRDPAVFIDGDKHYLLYSIRGENGIGIVGFSFLEE